VNNQDLKGWNEPIEAARAAKLDAMETAIRKRGFRRKVYLMFARLFARIEAMGTRWRNQQMSD
jgi:hypothetical protein